MSSGVCFSVIGTFVALSQVVLDLIPLLDVRLPESKLTRCCGQIDFTLIRIAADLAVNFFTTGW
jgi:hypothetical protein